MSLIHLHFSNFIFWYYIYIFLPWYVCAIVFLLYYVIYEHSQGHFCADTYVR